MPEDAHTAIIQLVQEQQDSQVIRRKALKGHKNHFYNANGRQLLKKALLISISNHHYDIDTRMHILT
ncbi:hypothetical protein AB6G19_06765 [Providencia manganoxydans]